MAKGTDNSERLVATVDELVGATRSASTRQIIVTKSLHDVPAILLSAGQRLRGKGDRITLTFAGETDGIRLSSDNHLSNLSIETAPARRAIWNDVAAGSLGTIELRDLSTIGRVQILLKERVRSGHVEVNNLDIVAGDAAGEKDRLHGYGVGVIQGAFTLWNMQGDPTVTVSANLIRLSAGRYGRPVLGSGIFVSGAGDGGGRTKVQRLEVASVYCDAKIRPGTPDAISGGVFTGKGVEVDEVRVVGPVVTYGANDMALDNWGVVDRWTADAKITTHGESGIGFVNFGDIAELRLKSPVETFGLGARGFNVYDGKVGLAEFERVVTHADGAVGVQLGRAVDQLVIHRGIETFGRTGPSLVKGVVQNLPAIALSIRPGARVQSIQIAGGLRTHGKGIAPLEQLGALDSLSIAGGVSGGEDGN
jgi:hypothetical protein